MCGSGTGTGRYQEDQFAFNGCSGHPGCEMKEPGMKSYPIIGAVTTQMGLELTSVLIEIPHLGSGLNEAWVLNVVSQKDLADGQTESCPTLQPHEL